MPENATADLSAAGRELLRSVVQTLRSTAECVVAVLDGREVEEGAALPAAPAVAQEGDAELSGECIMLMRQHLAGVGIKATFADDAAAKAAAEIKRLREELAAVCGKAAGLEDRLEDREAARQQEGGLTAPEPGGTASEERRLLTYVVSRGGSGRLVAQGVEVDLATSTGGDLDDLCARVYSQLACQLALDRQRGRPFLSGLRTAPERYAERAGRLTERRRFDAPCVSVRLVAADEVANATALPPEREGEPVAPPEGGVPPHDSRLWEDARQVFVRIKAAGFDPDKSIRAIATSLRLSPARSAPAAPTEGLSRDAVSTLANVARRFLADRVTHGYDSVRAAAEAAEGWLAEAPAPAAPEEKVDAERDWLAGRTAWWPDTLALPGSVAGVRRGCPSSPMPPLAQERIQKLYDAGEPYVEHVSPGVHRYRIGFVGDYFGGEAPAPAAEGRPEPGEVPPRHWDAELESALRGLAAALERKAGEAQS